MSMLTVCCSCNRVKEQEAWVMNYRDPSNDPVSHGYCPDCYTEIMDELSVTMAPADRKRDVGLHTQVPAPAILPGFTNRSLLS